VPPTVIVFLPVTAVPGCTPTLRSMVVAPVFVTVLPASTEKAEAVASGGTVASAWALAAIGPARNSAPRAAAVVNRAGVRSAVGREVVVIEGILYVVDQGARTEVISPEGGVVVVRRRLNHSFWYEKSDSAN
jgi:hypothetical protein